MRAIIAPRPLSHKSHLSYILEEEFSMKLNGFTLNKWAKVVVERSFNLLFGSLSMYFGCQAVRNNAKLYVESVPYCSIQREVGSFLFSL